MTNKLNVRELIRAVREKEEVIAILAHLASSLQKDYIGDELEGPLTLIQYQSSYSDQPVFVSVEAISRMVQSLQQQAAGLEADLDAMEVDVTPANAVEAEPEEGVAITK